MQILRLKNYPFLNGKQKQKQKKTSLAGIRTKMAPSSTSAGIKSTATLQTHTLTNMLTRLQYSPHVYTWQGITRGDLDHFRCNILLLILLIPFYAVRYGLFNIELSLIYNFCFQFKNSYSLFHNCILQKGYYNMT